MMISPKAFHRRVTLATVKLGLASKWVRLGLNGTNLGLLKISFSPKTDLKRSPSQNVPKLILKSPRFVPSVAHLPTLMPNLTSCMESSLYRRYYVLIIFLQSTTRAQVCYHVRQRRSFAYERQVRRFACRSEICLL